MARKLCLSCRSGLVDVCPSRLPSPVDCSLHRELPGSKSSTSQSSQFLTQRISMKTHPPYWTTWLLRQLHPLETLEEVEGDLEEMYAYWYRHKGERKANVLYIWAVLSVLP